MKTCFVKVFDDLQFFRKGKSSEERHSFSFIHKSTIRDVATSLGIPPPEIQFIKLNNQPVNLDNAVDDKNEIELYSGVLSGNSFILDVHLGTLTRYLRMLGFNCYYRNNLHDDEIINLSLKEERVILTRDLGILKNSKVKKGYFIRETKPEMQLRETIKKFNLSGQFNPFSLCMNCNGELIATTKSSIKKLVPAETYETYSQFFQCSQCSKIYWKGSHFHNMQQFISQL